jgi:hypothetical protein
MSLYRKKRIHPSKERTGYVPAKKGQDMSQQIKDRTCPSNEQEREDTYICRKSGGNGRCPNEWGN